MNSAMQFVLTIPEILVLIAGCLFILLGAFTDRKEAHTSPYILSLLVLLICFCVSSWIIHYHLFVNAPHVIYQGALVSDFLGTVLKCFLYFFVACALIYTRTQKRLSDVVTYEYCSILMFALLGMMVLCSAYSLLTIFVALELLSLSLYALIAIDAHNRLSIEAAVKFFVLGALVSGILLFGFSILYGVTLSLNMPLATVHAMYGVTHFPYYLIFIALIFVIIAVAFKLGLIPFHYWVPDVYESSHLTSLTIIASAVKIASFAFAFRLLAQLFSFLSASVALYLSIFAALSILLGNIAAIRQLNVRRMIGYSGIAQMGFMVLGFVAAADSAAPLLIADAYSASFLFIWVYALTTSAFMGAMMMLNRSGRSFVSINDFKGLFQHHPLMAFGLSIVLLSLAGIPPTLGFLAKFSVIAALVKQGNYALSVIAVIGSLIGLFFYLRIIKIIFFDEDTHAADHPVTLSLTASSLFVWTCSVVILLLGITCAFAFSSTTLFPLVSHALFQFSQDVSHASVIPL